ncbi:hypothetical protein M422DRAFT_40602 [Sphaerobolus stellatus SS14]|nr:hypothetical protein M422DRAFT_40602 [Sphaerobolus stellatus SS14]
MRFSSNADGSESRGSSPCLSLWLTTPSERLRRVEQISKYTKARVDSATEAIGTGKRCLIENTSQINAAQYAHCFARCKRSDMILERLEYSWKMRAGTLNLDSRYNICRLSAKFHILHDQHLWFFLPSDEIINKYHETRGNRNAFPNIEMEGYEYRVIAHPDMKGVPMLRQTVDVTDGSAVSFSDFIFIDYPYRGLTVTSHVRPKFAILNAAIALLSVRIIRFVVEFPDLVTTFNKVLQIYEAWINKVNPRDTDYRTWRLDKPPPEDDIDSNSSGSTRPRRSEVPIGDLSPEGKRGSPQTRSKKRKRDGPTEGLWLDNMALRELEKQEPSQKCTKNSIEEWISSIPSMSVGDTMEVVISQDCTPGYDKCVTAEDVPGKTVEGIST